MNQKQKAISRVIDAMFLGSRYYVRRLRVTRKMRLPKDAVYTEYYDITVQENGKWNVVFRWGITDKDLILIHPLSCPDLIELIEKNWEHRI